MYHAEHKPGLNGISRDLVDAWATRTVAQRPSNIVPSAFERVAFSTEPMEAGQRAGDWAVLSERDAVHLSGLLDLINQTGNLDVCALLCVHSSFSACSMICIVLSSGHHFGPQLPWGEGLQG